MNATLWVGAMVGLGIGFVPLIGNLPWKDLSQTERLMIFSFSVFCMWVVVGFVYLMQKTT